MLRSPRKSELSCSACLKRSPRRSTSGAVALTAIWLASLPTRWPASGRPLDQRFAADLALQLDDGIDQSFRSRWATRQIDVDRHDLVHALDDRIVVEHARGGGARPHRDHPLGLGHLVVNLAQNGR